MSKYNVQKFDVANQGGFICYPKVVSNDKTWDGRSEEGLKWEILAAQNVILDLISDAGMQEGDSVMVGVDVVAGSDPTCSKVFLVTKNGTTAAFDVLGTTLNNHMDYKGTN